MKNQIRSPRTSFVVPSPGGRAPELPRTQSGSPQAPQVSASRALPGALGTTKVLGFIDFLDFKDFQGFPILLWMS